MDLDSNTFQLQPNGDVILIKSLNFEVMIAAWLISQRIRLELRVFKCILCGQYIFSVSSANCFILLYTLSNLLC